METLMMSVNVGCGDTEAVLQLGEAPRRRLTKSEVRRMARAARCEYINIMCERRALEDRKRHLRQLLVVGRAADRARRAVVARRKR